MGPQKSKNETQKVGEFRVNYFRNFYSYIYAPLWAVRIGEKKYKNETEVRGILAIQVSIK